MPSYFFHLRLELYPTPAASPINKRRKLLHFPSHNVFIPAAGSDIFQTSFPAHKESQWDSYEFTKRPDSTTPKHSDSLHGHSSTPNSTRTTGSDSTGSPHREHTSESHGDVLLLPERTSNRKESSTPAPAIRPAKPSNPAAARDWRYDSVSIESIDIAMQTSNKRGGQQMKDGQSSGLHTKATYLPSNPTTTEIGWGVVHLYRDSEESGKLTDEIISKANADQGKRDKEERGDLDDCTTLCILAVPSWMMPSDLLGFVGDQAREDVSHFRLIRTGRANKYMVLMKFRSAKKARERQKAYNGRLFSAADPENCHVVFIKSVEFISPDSMLTETGDAAGSFPRNDAHDPFISTTTHPTGTTNNLTSKPLAPPPPNLLELPTCPVCLERMDETTGLLTILCQHVFHCACLEKWRFPGSGCPVCRYTQNPSYTFPYPRPQNGDQEDSEPVCSVCATDANLWICLICGNIGCGRYDSAHAFAHYEATSHCYAMDINTQRVWDYAGDGYVHRLIQSKPFINQETTTTSSAKSTAATTTTEYLPDRTNHRHANEAFRAEGDEMVPREKMESMANEYTYLLTSQLEGQRRYFEEQVERAADKAAEASARAEEAFQRAQTASETSQEHFSAHEALQKEVSRLEQLLDKTSKAKTKYETLAREMSSSLKEEKVMNEGLLKRLRAADDKAAEARQEADNSAKEMAELREMNRDLTMFISSQEKVRELQAQGEEVLDGAVSLPPEEQAKRGGGKKGKGKKK